MADLVTNASELLGRTPAEHATDHSSLHDLHNRWSGVNPADFVKADGSVAMSGELLLADDPTADLGAATKAYVDSVAAAGSTNLKTECKAAATGNVNVSNPGTAVFDGVTVTSGQRVLLPNQSTTTQNGVYVFNGSGSALTRPTDMDTGAEIEGAVFSVTGGQTLAGRWQNTNASTPTVGSDALTFVRTDPSPPYTSGTWTPTLTGSTTDPDLGDGFTYGRWSRIGDDVTIDFLVRVGTDGNQTTGAGTYYVDLPITAATPQYAAGGTSDYGGPGKIYRGFTDPDLLPGAHLEVTWHIVSTGDKALATFSPGALGGDVEVATKTSNQTITATAATDISGLSKTITPARRGARYRVKATVPIYKTSGSGDVFVQITDGTTIRRRAEYLPEYGTGLATGWETVDLEWIVENPPVGTAITYKVQAFSVDGSLVIAASSVTPAELMIEELPGVSTASFSESSDYVGAGNPWNIEDCDGGPWFTGRMTYKAAS